MTTLAATNQTPLPVRPPLAAHAVARLFRAAPLLSVTACAFLAGFAACSAAGLLDGRTINGANVWAKPAKFFLSVAIQSATLAWALAMLEPVATRLRGIRVACWLFAGWAALELAYIVIQAARGEASHFNGTSALYTALYALMGVGAVTMLVASGYIGACLLRRPDPAMNPVLTRALGLGLVVAASVGGISGAYMSAQKGHWVGGSRSDAGGLPVSGWSTSGGDLRVPHFFGLHSAQVIAAAGWLMRKQNPSRGHYVVNLVSVVWVALSLAIFVQALSGRPVIPLASTATRHYSGTSA